MPAYKRRILGQPEQDVRALAVPKFGDVVIHMPAACSRHINHLPFDDTHSQFRFNRCDYEIIHHGFSLRTCCVRALAQSVLVTLPLLDPIILWLAAAFSWDF